MKLSDKIIDEAVNFSFNKILKEYYNLKVATVFFKICELADSKNFTDNEWAELGNMCLKQAKKYKSLEKIINEEVSFSIKKNLYESFRLKVLFVFNKIKIYAKESEFNKEDWEDLANMCFYSHN